MAPKIGNMGPPTPRPNNKSWLTTSEALGEGPPGYTKHELSLSRNMNYSRHAPLERGSKAEQHVAQLQKLPRGSGNEAYHNEGFVEGLVGIRRLCIRVPTSSPGVMQDTCASRALTTGNISTNPFNENARDQIPNRSEVTSLQTHSSSWYHRGPLCPTGRINRCVGFDIPTHTAGAYDNRETLC